MVALLLKVDIICPVISVLGKDRYSSEGAIGMDIMDMFNDKLLASVLLFQKNLWSVHPDDMVTELLEQVHDMK